MRANLRIVPSRCTSTRKPPHTDVIVTCESIRYTTVHDNDNVIVIVSVIINCRISLFFCSVGLSHGRCPSFTSESGKVGHSLLTARLSAVTPVTEAKKTKEDRSGGADGKRHAEPEPEDGRGRALPRCFSGLGEQTKINAHLRLLFRKLSLDSSELLVTPKDSSSLYVSIRIHSPGS